MEIKEKKAGVAILISDKINFKIKTITRDKEGHYIMIKGSIQEEFQIILYTYSTFKEGEVSKEGEGNPHPLSVGCRKCASVEAGWGE